MDVKVFDPKDQTHAVNLWWMDRRPKGYFALGNLLNKTFPQLDGVPMSPQDLRDIRELIDWAIGSRSKR